MACRQTGAKLLPKSVVFKFTNSEYSEYGQSIGP